MSGSPRAHRWPAALVGAAMLTYGAAPQAPNPTRVPQKQEVEDLERWNEVASYFSVAATYRAGRIEQARKTILLWDDDDLAKDYETLVRLGHRVRVCREASPEIDHRTSAGEIEVADLDAAVLLHTDAVFAALEDHSAVRAGWQLVAARRLFEWTRDWTDGWSRAPGDLPRGCHPPPPIRRREWYLALTWTLLVHWEAYLADVMAGSALDAAPTDPEVLLAAGTVKEALAIDAIQYPNTRPGVAREFQAAFGRPPLRDAGRSLRDALALYLRALDTRPVYVQTHLRLGRVLSLLDRLDEARAELELVAANADAARERYLAELFLARVAEQADDETAVVHYRRAIDAWPDSQAARVGLAQALGRKDAASATPPELREVLSQSWPRAITSDPWWVYPFGESERGPQLLDALRERLLKGELNGRRN